MVELYKFLGIERLDSYLELTGSAEKRLLHHIIFNVLCDKNYIECTNHDILISLSLLVWFLAKTTGQW